MNTKTTAIAMAAIVAATAMVGLAVVDLFGTAEAGSWYNKPRNSATFENNQFQNNQNNQQNNQGNTASCFFC